jgi:hypothetical protein
MKKCSPFLAIKEMQMKTTLRFHLTLVRMATIKNTTNNKCGKDAGGRGWAGERNLHTHTAGGNVS